MSKVLCNIQQVYGRPGAFLAPLRDAGFEIVMNDKDRLLTEDELIERLPGVVATIAGGELYTDRVFASAPALRVVARFGVGYDRVDVDGGDPPWRRRGDGVRHQPRERRRLRLRAHHRPRGRALAASRPGRRRRLGLRLPSRPLGAVHGHRRPRPDRQGDGAPLPRLRDAAAGHRPARRRGVRRGERHRAGRARRAAAPQPTSSRCTRRWRRRRAI